MLLLAANLLDDYVRVNRNVRPDGGLVAESCGIGRFGGVSTKAINGVCCARSASKGASLRVCKPSGVMTLVRMTMGSGALFLDVSGSGGMHGFGGVGVAVASPALGNVSFGKINSMRVRGKLAASGLSVRDGKMNGISVRSLAYRGLGIRSVNMNSMGLRNATRVTTLRSGKINGVRTKGLQTGTIRTDSRNMKSVAYGTARSVSTTMQKIKDVGCGNDPAVGSLDGGKIKAVGGVWCGGSRRRRGVCAVRSCGCFFIARRRDLFTEGTGR